jgi:hypothetical protein
MNSSIQPWKKVDQNFRATSVIFLNNHPTGENSHNLVTLFYILLKSFKTELKTGLFLFRESGSQKKKTF